MLFRLQRLTPLIPSYVKGRSNSLKINDNLESPYIFSLPLPSKNLTISAVQS
jgi:hypothetical protein